MSELTVNEISGLQGTVKINGQVGLPAVIGANKLSVNGTIYTEGSTEVVTTPHYLTVQIAIDQHIHLSPAYLQFINHSCNPTVLFNTTTMELESVRDIKAGDEFTFFYPATEWKMSQKFDCHCCEKNCIGLIQGAADTSIEILNKYKLTDFIQSMLIEKGYTRL